MTNRTLVDAIRAGLASRADPVRAPLTQTYMKSAMPYYGVVTALQRELYRELFAIHPLATFESWQDTIMALWTEAQFREEKYAALALVGWPSYRRFRTLDVLPLYERLIVGGAWWDLVDGLATHEVGDLLRDYRRPMQATLLGWSTAADPWLRRTSIICQVGFKRSTDQQLLYACIEPSLTERYFFLRKAIGWALREYGKVAPDEVHQYVEQHAGQLSALSKREALKYVEARMPA